MSNHNMLFDVLGERVEQRRAIDGRGHGCGGSGKEIARPGSLSLCSGEAATSGFTPPCSVRTFSSGRSTYLRGSSGLLRTWPEMPLFGLIRMAMISSSRFSCLISSLSAAFSVAPL